MNDHSKPADSYHPWTTYIYAREEARRRGDRRVGTEHLLLGLAREPQLAEAVGCELHNARDALDTLDREAIAATVGASLDAPPIPTDDIAELPPKPTLKAVLRDRLPLTPAAKTALRTSGKDLRHGRSITPQQVLLTLLELEPPDPSAELLAALGADRAAIRKRLTENASST